jgi:flotillin
MTTALIIVGSVLVALLVIAFAVWAHQYTKVGPNEVLIISGRRGPRKDGRRGYRVVRGGGTYVWPFRERVQRLSLELLQFDVRTQETYTAHGVPVQIDGVCMVKIDSSDVGIERMGLQIVSLTVRNIADKQGYLEALGRPRTAQVKRDAIRGEAVAEREARAARYEADLSIEASRRDYETQRAAFKAEGQRAAAEADLSYDLQQAITRQRVRAEELGIEIVERQKRIELMQAEVERRKRELEAEIVEPAVAKAREIEAHAEAHREETAALGAGEADALRLKGLAEAEAMAAKARSWGDYNQAAITDRVLEVLPELASAVSAPLAQTDRIVMIGGNGSTPGASKITRDVTQVVAELPSLLEALTGLKLEDMAKRVPGVRDSDADSTAEEVR